MIAGAARLRYDDSGRDGESPIRRTAAGTKRCTRAAMVGGFGMVAFPSPPRDRRRSRGQPRADERPRRLPAPLAKSPLGPLATTERRRPPDLHPRAQRHANVPRLANSSPLPRFVAVNQVLRPAWRHCFGQRLSRCQIPGAPRTRKKRARLPAKPSWSSDPKLTGTAVGHCELPKMIAAAARLRYE